MRGENAHSSFFTAGLLKQLLQFRFGGQRPVLRRRQILGMNARESDKDIRNAGRLRTGNIMHQGISDMSNAMGWQLQGFQTRSKMLGLRFAKPSHGASHLLIALGNGPGHVGGATCRRLHNAIGIGTNTRQLSCQTLLQQGFYHVRHVTGFNKITQTIIDVICFVIVIPAPIPHFGTVQKQPIGFVDRRCHLNGGTHLVQKGGWQGRETGIVQVGGIPREHESFGHFLGMRIRFDNIPRRFFSRCDGADKMRGVKTKFG
mmetsp:Transcript_13168/g.27321  ORF Transcript_13168/g.27321 Transcript_13168/m.27321 type:complete len:259 (-) Transcript_13168:25-801(-)